MEMPQPHHLDVPDAKSFSDQRRVWRDNVAKDQVLQSKANDLMSVATRHRYGYQWAWCGVPIIRWPDDIMLMQEIVWAIRPSCVIETGIARGGSLILSASLMAMTGVKPAVLGMDIAIYPHAHVAVESSPWRDNILMWEGNSASAEACDVLDEFLLSNPGPAVLVLDSDHTHDHVLAELRMLASRLPKDSFVIVADTVIETLPADHHIDRPWGAGNNPATAIKTFLVEDERFELAGDWGRRALLSEMRDGVLQRTKL